MEQGAKRYRLLRTMMLQMGKGGNSSIFDELEKQPEPTDEASFDAALDAVMVD
jgi:hypothetical protein